MTGANAPWEEHGMSHEQQGENEKGHGDETQTSGKMVEIPRNKYGQLCCPWCGRPLDSNRLGCAMCPHPGDIIYK